MGFFYSVRGWLDMDEEQCQKVQAIVSADEDAVGTYATSWHFPYGGGGCFGFFGCNVRDVSLPRLRAQIERIATTVVSHDGDITDEVIGVFHVEPEDESCEIIWRLKSGQFTETRQPLKPSPGT